VCASLLLRCLLAPVRARTARHVPGLGNAAAVDRGVDWAPGTPSTVSAVCAIAGGISAAHMPVAPGRAYGKQKVYGAIP
jgi:hypothetical protein